jgi:hypothetical protein
MVHMRNRTSQIQFLQSISLIDVDHCDIIISDYNHAKLRKLKDVSKLRWVKGKRLNLYPGGGSGTITIGGHVFRVTYAWGGRDKPGGGWEDRTAYVVRIEGENIQKRIEALRKAIILDEKGCETYQIPFREWTVKFGNKNEADIRKSVRELNAFAKKKKLKTLPPEFVSNWIKGFKKDWAENPPVTLEYGMNNIEADRI